MFAAFFHRAVLQAISLLFGCTGEILTEKSGNLNLGIPGIMYVGGISGVIGAFIYENSLPDKSQANWFLAIIIPLLCCLAGSLIMGLIYSFLTTTLRANQNVTGLALTTFGVGLGKYFGGVLIKLVNADVPSVTVSLTSNFYKTTFPFAEDLGWFGEMFLSYGFLTYVAVIIAIIAAVYLKRTRPGLNLRAVGENPATADAAGISVTKYKYFATCIGSMIAGMGGLFYVMNNASGVWSNNGLDNIGWLAIALVIFTVWKPNFAILGAFLFGALSIAPYYLSLYDIVDINLRTKPFFDMMPYIVTVVVLIINSLRKKRESQPPEALGLSYFREDR